MLSKWHCIRLTHQTSVYYIKQSVIGLQYLCKSFNTKFILKCISFYLDLHSSSLPSGNMKCIKLLEQKKWWMCGRQHPICTIYPAGQSSQKPAQWSKSRQYNLFLDSLLWGKKCNFFPWNTWKRLGSSWWYSALTDHLFLHFLKILILPSVVLAWRTFIGFLPEWLWYYQRCFV